MCRPDETMTSLMEDNTDIEDSTMDLEQSMDVELTSNWPQLATSAEWKELFRAYYNSGDLAELVCCLTFFGVLHAVFDYAHFSTHQRPLPVFALETEGATQYVPDQRFNHAYNGETIPGSLNKKLLLIPITLQLILSVAIPKLRQQKDWHKTLCAYLIASPLCDTLTKSMKKYVGYFRPVFWDFCEPNQTYSECLSGNEKRTSFPSSHSSMSFVNYTLLALFLYYRFGMPTARRYVKVCDARTNELYYTLQYDNNNNRTFTKRLGSLLSVLPLLWALFVACSRLVDNMHHPVDIVAGSLLGGSVACGVHGLWFV